MLKTKQFIERIVTKEFIKEVQMYKFNLIALDTQINEFLEKEGVSADMLVDIKYSTTEFEGDIRTAALILYTT